MPIESRQRYQDDSRQAQADEHEKGCSAQVDADYTKKNYDEWTPSDWPKLYQNPTYKNIFAAGIAFAPPHPISKPMHSKKGTPIFPTPPRTGMPTGVMAREIAYNITDMMTGKADTPTEFTKRSRTNIFYQLLRFIVLNIRMLKMIRKH